MSRSHSILAELRAPRIIPHYAVRRIVLRMHAVLFELSGYYCPLCSVAFVCSVHATIGNTHFRQTASGLLVLWHSARAPVVAVFCAFVFAKTPANLDILMHRGYRPIAAAAAISCRRCVPHLSYSPDSGLTAVQKFRFRYSSGSEIPVQKIRGLLQPPVTQPEASCSLSLTM